MFKILFEKYTKNVSYSLIILALHMYAKNLNLSVCLIATDCILQSESEAIMTFSMDVILFITLLHNLKINK